MFTKTKQTRTDLDDALTRAFTELETLPQDGERYAQIMDQIVKLKKLKNDTESPSRISPDTLAMVGANLAGILLVINHERAQIITSKAFGMLLKPR